MTTNEPGIAWTSDRRVAERYARDYTTLGETRLVVASAPPQAILARFQHEDEVVIVPELLIDVRDLGRVPQFTLPRLTPF